MAAVDVQIERHIELLMERYPVLAPLKGDIKQSYRIMEACYQNGGKLLIAGNVGSAADADHIVGELMKGFVKPRKVTAEFAARLRAVDLERGSELAENLQEGLPSIALSNHPALTTAFLNDVDGIYGFAQQVNGYGKPGDVLLGISTSGNSNNILYAAVTAKAKGMKVIGLTGRDGGKLKGISDVTVIVPEKETFMIQELHLPIYHCLCLMLEERFFE